MPKCSFCQREMLEAEVWQSKVDVNNFYCHNEKECVHAYGHRANELLKAGK